MYLLASASVVVECPRHKAFEYVADLTRFAQWFPAVIEVQARDQTIATLGKVYEETISMPLRGRRSVMLRVVDVRMPSRFVTEGSLPLLLPRMEIDFEDVASTACRIQWRMLSRNSARLPRWTVLPLARLTLQKRAETAMRRLKRRLESGNDARSAPPLQWPQRGNEQTPRP
jgi:hypothetical protein